MKKQKWYALLGIILVLVGLGGYWFVNKYHDRSQEQMSSNKEKLVLNEQQSDQKQLINELRSSIQKLEKEKSVLQEENKQLKNNAASDKGNLQHFDEMEENLQKFTKTVEQAFHALFDYDPDTFSERKQACEPYLSKDLIAQYFTESRYYGDSNSVSSELETCTLYTKTIQDNELQGLVVAEYQNKIGNSSWNKAMNVFQVTYDPLSERLIAIQNLGSSFNGSLFE